ncbi:hypothetical protein BCR41DRAFT_191135 [Lobosporangium transversale]|uniref:Uncharacterized protein n=1 Tax=Lobosporangium transversale TaxID=64571 RepID=A0A1Y2GBQ0_9FUNG|nr:hypothetical protein BCR41DRAFT_191135 [Lobosporangium transversale]ORZ05008.1 hypothetical protein BCR41DRAFT_191135 [Lobosporangium transversale]|eukprot:XP_021876872.1 hypothetical protein BCR41DRAFT_191135 [Lobosporangium transversale]
MTIGGQSRGFSWHVLSWAPCGFSFDIVLVSCINILSSVACFLSSSRLNESQFLRLLWFAGREVAMTIGGQSRGFSWHVLSWAPCGFSFDIVLVSCINILSSVACFLSSSRLNESQFLRLLWFAGREVAMTIGGQSRGFSWHVLSWAPCGFSFDVAFFYFFIICFFIFIYLKVMTA